MRRQYDEAPERGGLEREPALLAQLSNLNHKLTELRSDIYRLGNSVSPAISAGAEGKANRPVQRSLRDLMREASSIVTDCHQEIKRLHEEVGEPKLPEPSRG
jgi:hypothetical protein